MKGKRVQKHIESMLQDVHGFDKPNIELEQYATPPHIAAIMLDTINMEYDAIGGQTVADLGCGTGTLTIGSHFLGAKMVHGFDIDQAALKTCLRNIRDMFGDDEQSEDLALTYKSSPEINLICINIGDKDGDRFWQAMRSKFDTVIMNPPFGTKKNPGIDIVFLKRAIEISSGAVYSLHKTSTRKFIQKKCRDEWQVDAKPISQIKYNLESSYKFHKHSSVDIDVDLWRIDCLTKV